MSNANLSSVQLWSAREVKFRDAYLKEDVEVYLAGIGFLWLIKRRAKYYVDNFKNISIFRKKKAS